MVCLDFLAIQVRDLERAGDFYERHLGMLREAQAVQGVVAFRTATIPFAVREPLPGTDLDAGPVGIGIAASRPSVVVIDISSTNGAGYRANLPRVTPTCRWSCTLVGLQCRISGRP